MRTFWLCLLFAMAASAEKTVAVIPIQPRTGALAPADAKAVTEEIEAAAREALAPHAFEVIAGEGAPAEALKAGAAAALFGRAAQMEGATVVAVGVYLPGATAPAGLVRIVGIGVGQLRADARAKIPKLVTTALGLAAAVEEPRQAPGTLRMPSAATQPQPQPRPEAPNPSPAPPPAPSPSPPRDENPLVTLIRDVTSDVEQLRGLRRKQNLKILILDDKLFSRAVREKALKELTPALVAAERARWTAFALAPADADPAKILLGVLDEQVAGFYDPFTRQLVVRKEPPAPALPDEPPGEDARNEAKARAAEADANLRLVLAHEIEHALQDQNFGIPDLKKLPDDDARLARAALFEGDAMAVMTAYGARHSRKPIKPAILAGAAMMKATDSETLLRLSGKSPELLRAPAILREELLFPYSAGFALVAEAYRRGGFALVDRMFRNPPQSSHQVLHPEAYFAGEQANALAAPAAPAGTRVVATGRMGEAGARLAMEVCVDRAVVHDFAPKWSGDAYTIVEGPGRALSLLWTSAWTGEGAANVANLLHLEQPCWEDGAPPSFAAASKIRSAGNLVAVARGSVDLDAAVARQLAVKTTPPRAAPPLGDVPPPPGAEPARVEDGQFTSPRLALRGTVPEGYEQDSGDAQAELAIRRSNAGGATLSLVQEPLAGDALETFFQAASGKIATAQGAHLSLVGSAQSRLAGAPAEERIWVLEGARTRLRIDVAPFCGGKAALALVRIEIGETARDALERFAASIQPSGTAPVCADLQ